MKFDWRYFTKEDYEKIRLRNPESNKELDYLGCVCIGDIAIDLVNRYYSDGKNHLDYDLYVGHEDTGYGYKSIPYDYAEGGGFVITEDMTYEEFKVIAEKDFEYFIYINSYDHSDNMERKRTWESGLNLLDHAYKPLEIWNISKSQKKQERLNMEYLWIYKVIVKDLSNYITLSGVVSAEYEEEAKERVYDSYNNYGIKVNEIDLIKVSDYKGYDVDHNVLELKKVKTKVANSNN